LIEIDEQLPSLDGFHKQSMLPPAALLKVGCPCRAFSLMFPSTILHCVFARFDVFIYPYRQIFLSCLLMGWSLLKRFCKKRRRICMVSPSGNEFLTNAAWHQAVVGGRDMILRRGEYENINCHIMDSFDGIDHARFCDVLGAMPNQTFNEML
jgi:hypothetical protein